jgi:probable selenate reductase FAD-binding subunit
MENVVFDHIQAFHQPTTLDEALRLLQKHPGKACPVAGDTDLALRAGRSAQVLVDITRLGLSYVKREGKGLRIGATTTMAALEESALVQRLANGILSKAASTCGSPQLRNVATLGGNLVNASPAADTATPLLALDAEVILQGVRSKRRVPLVKFFLAPHKTAVKDALLTEIVIPPLKLHAAWCFEKFGRTEPDISIVNVTVGLQLDAQHRCTWVRIALGAVAPTPMRAIKAEALMSGQVLTEKLIERASQSAAEESRPIDDLRASAEYRRDISRVLVRRALQACAAHLEGAQ